MNRPVRRYVEKFEALDIAAGTYHARKLPRARYNRTDFLEYLSELEAETDAHWEDLEDCETA